MLAFPCVAIHIKILYAAMKLEWALDKNRDKKEEKNALKHQQHKKSSYISSSKLLLYVYGTCGVYGAVVLVVLHPVLVALGWIRVSQFKILSHFMLLIPTNQDLAPYRLIS